MHQIPPLILIRGYAGGDEARMLQRHFHSKSVQVGVGTTRAAIAMYFLRKYGYQGPHSELYAEKNFLEPENGDGTLPKLGAAILDDGMQHLQLIRDVNIVMVHGLLPWGNGHLIPLEPLREPLTALERAEIAVIHNADMVPKQDLKCVEETVREANESIHTFFTRMTLMNFREVQDMNFEIPLEAVSGKVVLCLSATGSADTFVQSVEKDIRIIKQRLRELENESGGIKPVVILTEKDYHRDPQILKYLRLYQTRAPTRIPSSACLRNYWE